MRPALLGLLACPACGSALALDGGASTDWVETGGLSCAACRTAYPIEEGIPRFAAAAGLGRGERLTRERFGYEWLRYPGSLEEDRRVFLEETQVSEAGWNGRRVLDAGCGMGRYAAVARALGAEVVAFDLSEALTRLAARARADERLHPVQGDLLKPPFKPGSFDVVYSQGVLHHASDTKTAFGKVAPLVAPGGTLTVWVYGTPGPWSSFRTNPLRSGRGWVSRLRLLVWLVVWARQAFSDGLRLLTVRLPHPLLYALCYPLAALGALPGIKYLTFSSHALWRVRLQENFDWLAPPYQHKHTKEEVRGWFEEAGFDPGLPLAHGIVPKVGLAGRRRGG